MKPKLKKRMRQHIFTAITVFFGMFFIAGCAFSPVTGNVVEKEYQPSGSKYNWSKGKWEHKSECFELDIVDQKLMEHELCVSERVFNDAMLGHQITLTEDYR